MLRGNLPATIDGKGRIKVPAAFRKFIEDTYGNEFYVTSLTGQSVLVYPISEWEEIEARLNALPRMKPERLKFLRNTSFYGQVALMDKQGRVVIQPHLRTSADMRGEVAVMGNLTHLEVWNNEKFVSRMESDPFTPEDAEQLGI